MGLRTRSQGLANVAAAEGYAPFRPGRTHIKRPLTEALVKSEPLTCGTAGPGTREFTNPYVRSNRACLFSQQELESMEQFDKQVSSIMANKNYTPREKQRLLDHLVNSTK